MKGGEGLWSGMSKCGKWRVGVPLRLRKMKLEEREKGKGGIYR